MKIQDKVIYSINQFDYVIQHLANKIITKGQDNIDRTKIGTKSIFSEKISVDLSDYSIPISTLKQTPFKNTLRELLWFLTGSSNVNTLHSKVQHWWTPWQKDNGDIGNMYYMMRDYSVQESNRWDYGITSTKIDQFKDVIDSLIKDPSSRRHVISLWNPNLDNMVLANCHGTHIQFYVEDGRLSMDTYQRSMDFLLGGLVNFTSYAILLHIVAHLTGLQPGILNYGIGDLHIYNNHLEAAEEIISRTPIDCTRTLDIASELTFDTLMYDLTLQKDKLDVSIDNIVNMFTLTNYTPHKSIKLKIAV